MSAIWTPIGGSRTWFSHHPRRSSERRVSLSSVTTVRVCRNCALVTRCITSSYETAPLTSKLNFCCVALSRHPRRHLQLSCSASALTLNFNYKSTSHFLGRRTCLHTRSLEPLCACVRCQQARVQHRYLYTTGACTHVPVVTASLQQSDVEMKVPRHPGL